MTKINCCINLRENDTLVIDNKKVIGLKNKNKITYNDDNMTVTISLNDNKITMERVCDEYTLTLPFEEKTNTSGRYFSNKLNLWLPLDIFTDKILVSEKSVKIKYKIEDKKFDFVIDFEVI